MGIRRKILKQGDYKTSESPITQEQFESLLYSVSGDVLGGVQYIYISGFLFSKDSGGWEIKSEEPEGEIWYKCTAPINEDGTPNLNFKITDERLTKK